MKKILIGCITAVLLLANSTTAFALDDFWKQPRQGSTPSISWSEQGLDFPSFYRPFNDDCSQHPDVSCDAKQATYGHGFVDYRVCQSVTELYCVESLIVKVDGVTYEATKIAEASGNKIVVPLENGIIYGGSPTIWEVTLPSGRQLFASKFFSGFSWNNSPVHVDKIEMAISPVRIGSGECVLSASGNCYIEQSAAPNYRLGASLRLPPNLGGFFMGRIQDATVDQKLANDGSFEHLAIEASPVEIPRVSVPSPTTLPSELSGCKSGCSYPDYDGGALMPSGPYATAWGITSSLANKSQARAMVWRAYAMSPTNTEYSTCAAQTNGFIGTSSTNALLYDYNPPTFQNGFFNFKLGGLHYKSDGTLEQGTYQLTISKKFAECLYKFSNAPISATVSVIDADGQTAAAVTTVSEDAEWLHISSTGFTFSNPTVRVALSQAKVIETPSSSVQASPAAKKCINKSTGKVISLKATAGNPKCPKGYKFTQSK